MSSRRNFLDGDNSRMERNLRFVKNDLEDNLNQYFGGSGSRGGGGRDSGTSAPPRDYKVVQPQPVLASHGLEERKQFLQQIGVARHEAYDFAKATNFDVQYYQKKRFNWCNSSFTQLHVDNLLLDEIKSGNYIRNNAANLSFANQQQTRNRESLKRDYNKANRDYKTNSNSQIQSSRNTFQSKRDAKSGDQSKRNTVSRSDYSKAVFILKKIARNQLNGTVDERDVEDRKKYQAVVDEYLKSKGNLTQSPSRNNAPKKTNKSVKIKPSQGIAQTESGDQSKKKSKSSRKSLKNRYSQALFILDRIAKNASNGTVHDHDEQDRIKYQAVVDEYHKMEFDKPEEANSKRNDESDETSKEKQRKNQSIRDSLKSRFSKAIFILDKIAQNELDGTINENDEADRAKYEAVVEEYYRHQAKSLDAHESETDDDYSGNHQTKSKKKRSHAQILRIRYSRAIHILDKIEKNAKNGTVHERDEEDKIKYQAVVEEYLKHKANLDSSTTTTVTKPNDITQRDAEVGQPPKKKNKKSISEIWKARYSRAIVILDKIEQNAKNNTVHERDEEDRIKYQDVIEEYRKFKASADSESEIESATDVLARINYSKAVYILGKIAKNALKGTVHENDEADQIKYQAVVDEYLKHKAELADNSAESVENTEGTKLSGDSEGDTAAKRIKLNEEEDDDKMEEEENKEEDEKMEEEEKTTPQPIS